MKRKLSITLAASAATALLLSGCSLLEGDNASGSNSENDGSDNVVYNAMTTWDACEVLNNLQPITDKMGIQGYGSSTSPGGEPSTAEFGNTLDPDAIGCNDLIYLGQNDWTGASGEIKVKIVPTENEEQATTAYEDRVSTAESDAAKGTDAQTKEFGDPWDQGTIVAWIDDTSNPSVEVIAREGQWVFHIDLYHSPDYGLENKGEPALAFADEELNQWFVDTYAPEVNQIVNDRIAEAQ